MKKSLMASLLPIGIFLSSCGDDVNVTEQIGIPGPQGEVGPKGSGIKYVERTVEVTEIRGVSPTPHVLDFDGLLIVPTQLIAPVLSPTTQQGWITLRLGQKRLCYQRRNSPTSSTVYDLRYAKLTLVSAPGDSCSDNNNYGSNEYMVTVEAGDEIIVGLDSPQIPNGMPVAFTFKGWGFINE